MSESFLVYVASGSQRTSIIQDYFCSPRESCESNRTVCTSPMFPHAFWLSDSLTISTIRQRENTSVFYAKKWKSWTENGNATVHVRVLDTRAANGALTLPEPNVIPSSSAVAVWMSERRWWFACESRVHLGVRREKKRIAVDAAIARTAGYKLSYHRSKCRNNQRFRWSFRKFPTVLWKLIAMQGFLVEIHCNYLTATIYGNCKTIE